MNARMLPAARGPSSAGPGGTRHAYHGPAGQFKLLLGVQTSQCLQGLAAPELKRGGQVVAMGRSSMTGLLWVG